MKEVEKKDLPEIPGGLVIPYPTDPPPHDPLGLPIPGPGPGPYDPTPRSDFD